MNFKKQETNNYLLYDTPVENIFISEYAKNAPGDYVKVYLTALMYADQERDFDNAKLASALSMSAKQVEDAWDYWQECGLVERRAKAGGKDSEIEFVSLKEKFFSKAAGAPAVSRNAEKLNNREVADLFKNIEKETGRLLEAKEPETVALWLKEFGMDPEVILLGYRYCVKNGRSTRYRYVDKILMDWRERGLDTKESVEEFLEETDRKYSYYRQVFKVLGFRRNPTQAEMDIMDSWIDQGFSLDEVKEACKKTSGISSPSINYVSTVLKSQKAKDASMEAEDNAKLLQAVEERYDRIRYENARTTEKLREKIYTDIPGLKDVSDEIMSLGIRISRSILKGASGKAELSEARERQAQLGRKRSELLIQGGYREDALDPIYTCKKCSDTGVLEDGRRCSCFYDRLKEVKNEQ